MQALLLVDVLKDFEHEDGDRLLADFREHHGALVRTLAEARADGRTVAYANDAPESGDADPAEIVRRAVEGRAGELMEELVPEPGELFVIKPGYSGFHGTELDDLLRERGETALDVAGTATEMCVFQTATDAVRLGFAVAVLADACASVEDRHQALALQFLEEVLGVDVVRG